MIAASFEENHPCSPAPAPKKFAGIRLPPWVFQTSPAGSFAGDARTCGTSAEVVTAPPCTTYCSQNSKKNRRMKFKQKGKPMRPSINNYRPSTHGNQVQGTEEAGSTDQDELVGGLGALLLDLIIDALPKGAPRTTLRTLHRMGFRRDAVAKKLGVKEKTVRQNEWRAFCLARRIAENDEVLQWLFEVTFQK
jgi:hypothetical protein